jgi:hypothetical protein
MKATDRSSIQLDLFAESTPPTANVVLVRATPSPLSLCAPVVALHEKRLEKEAQAERMNTRRVLALLDF